MTNPLVSVCIPTYNGALFLQEALDSVSEQTYKNIEVIVSDDASKDNTLEIVSEFKKTVSFPVYIDKHDPSGIGANWNNCVKKSNGKYIKFLFQDDILKPECIDEMMNLMASDNKIGLVYSTREILFNPTNTFHINFINSYKYLHNSWYDITVSDLSIVKGTKFLKDKNLFQIPENKIGEPTAVLLKKACFNKVGYFDIEMKQALDFEYWYRVMAHYKIGFIDKELISFRLHDDQASYVNAENAVSEVDLVLYKFYQKIFWKLNINNKVKLFLMFSPLAKLSKRLINKIKKIFK